MEKLHKELQQLGVNCEFNGETIIIEDAGYCTDPEVVLMQSIIDEDLGIEFNSGDENSKFVVVIEQMCFDYHGVNTAAEIKDLM